MNEILKTKIHYYSPHFLKLSFGSMEATMLGVSNINLMVHLRGNVVSNLAMTSEVKPHFRPISSLENPIYKDDSDGYAYSLSMMITHGAHNDFWLPKNFRVDHLYHSDFELLVAHHFWLWDQSLFDTGELIKIENNSK